MKRLTSVQSLVYTLMDKLGPVREVLVQKDDDWEEWGLEELVENLQKYVERNPLKESRQDRRKLKEPPWPHPYEQLMEERQRKDASWK